MLVDRVTGEKREVYVLVVATTATYEVTLGIEVVAWGRPADTPWVEKMRAKHENLPTDKLILVSASGFSEPALRKAEFYRIEALSIEEACDADWPLIATLEKAGVIEVTTVSFSIAAVCQMDDGTIEQMPVPAQAAFETAAGPMTMDSFVRSILDKDEVREVIRANLNGDHEHAFWFSYTEPEGLLRFDIDGKKGQMTELRVGLNVMQVATPVQFGSGKFRSTPFLSGASLLVQEPLQFVLAKRPDGTTSGYLIDSTGVRTLSSRSRPASEQQPSIDTRLSR